MSGFSSSTGTPLGRYSVWIIAVLGGLVGMALAVLIGIVSIDFSWLGGLVTVGAAFLCTYLTHASTTAGVISASLGTVLFTVGRAATVVIHLSSSEPPRGTTRFGALFTAIAVTFLISGFFSISAALAGAHLRAYREPKPAPRPTSFQQQAAQAQEPKGPAWPWTLALLGAWLLHGGVRFYATAVEGTTHGDAGPFLVPTLSLAVLTSLVFIRKVAWR